MKTIKKIWKILSMAHCDRSILAEVFNGINTEDAPEEKIKDLDDYDECPDDT